MMDLFSVSNCRYVNARIAAVAEVFIADLFDWGNESDDYRRRGDMGYDEFLDRLYNGKKTDIHSYQKTIFYATLVHEPCRFVTVEDAELGSVEVDLSEPCTRFVSRPVLGHTYRGVKYNRKVSMREQAIARLNPPKRLPWLLLFDEKSDDPMDRMIDAMVEYIERPARQDNVADRVKAGSISP